MTIYGYCRDATDSQSLEEQKQILLDENCDEVWVEELNEIQKQPVRDKLLIQLKKGDTLVIKDIARLSRSVGELSKITLQLQEKGVNLRVLDPKFPSGEAVYNFFTMLQSVSFMEHEIISRRIKEGKAIARKREGYVEGRPKKYTPEELEQAMELLKSKTYDEVAAITNISRSTLVREKKKRKNLHNI